MCILHNTLIIRNDTQWYHVLRTPCLFCQLTSWHTTPTYPTSQFLAPDSFPTALHHHTTHTLPFFASHLIPMHPFPPHLTVFGTSSHLTLPYLVAHSNLPKEHRIPICPFLATPPKLTPISYPLLSWNSIPSMPDPSCHLWLPVSIHEYRLRISNVSAPYQPAKWLDDRIRYRCDVLWCIVTCIGFLSNTT